MNNEFTQEMIVSERQTAREAGSGTLDVLATPALIAFMENTAMQMLSHLPEGETSVGTLINVQHLKASTVGETIRCTAKITTTEGRRYTFELTALNAAGEIVAQGTHERFAVDAQRFMSKLQKK